MGQSAWSKSMSSKEEGSRDIHIHVLSINFHTYHPVSMIVGVCIRSLVESIIESDVLRGIGLLSQVLK